MKTGNNYLIETALITHGISNLKESEILNIWENDKSTFAWLNRGHLETGYLEKFLNFKSKNTINLRISSDLYMDAKQKGLTGALTASGTMCACEELNLPYAVSAGIGGISDIIDEPFCPDLEKIKSSHVTLVATSFKDMMDRYKTFKWLKANNVEVLEKNGDKSTGFMFKLEVLTVDGKYINNTNMMKKKQLLLNEISIEKRFENICMLKEMIIAGKEAEQKEDYYHPAANNKLAELTNNRSTKKQIRSLLDNARWTRDISS